MPVNRYYHGHGNDVMAAMKRKYGDEQGERVFYATANKKHQKPADDEPSLRPSLRHLLRRP